MALYNAVLETQESKEYMDICVYVCMFACVCPYAVVFKRVNFSKCDIIFPLSCPNFHRRKNVGQAFVVLS